MTASFAIFCMLFDSHSQHSNKLFYKVNKKGMQLAKGQLNVFKIKRWELRIRVKPLSLVQAPFGTFCISAQRP